MSTDPDPIKVREENEMQLVVTTGRQLGDSHTATRGADMQIGGPNGTKRKRDPRKTKAQQENNKVSTEKKGCKKYTQREGTHKRENAQTTAVQSMKKKNKVLERHAERSPNALNHRTGKQAIEKRKTKQKAGGDTRGTQEGEEMFKKGKKTVLGVESPSDLPPFISVYTCLPLVRDQERPGRSPRPYPVVPRKMVRGRCLGAGKLCGCRGVLKRWSRCTGS